MLKTLNLSFLDKNQRAATRQVVRRSAATRIKEALKRGDAAALDALPPPVEEASTKPSTAESPAGPQPYAAEGAGTAGCRQRMAHSAFSIQRVPKSCSEFGV